MLAERQPDLELLLERVDPQGGEPAGLVPEPVVAPRPCSAGPRQRASAASNGIRAGEEVAVAKGAARLPPQLLEADRVHARLAPGRSRRRSRRSPPRPRAARSRAMWWWSALRGAAGSSSPQRPSTSMSTRDDAARDGARASPAAPAASRPRRPPGRPPTRTSNGPRTRISSRSGMRTSPSSVVCSLAHFAGAEPGQRKGFLGSTGYEAAI